MRHYKPVMAVLLGLASLSAFADSAASIRKDINRWFFGGEEKSQRFLSAEDLGTKCQVVVQNDRVQKRTQITILEKGYSSFAEHGETPSGLLFSIAESDNSIKKGAHYNLEKIIHVENGAGDSLEIAREWGNPRPGGSENEPTQLYFTVKITNSKSNQTASCKVF